MKRKILLLTCVLVALFQISYTRAYAQDRHAPHRHVASYAMKLETDNPLAYYGVYNLETVGTSINEWVVGDYATLNTSSSTATKYSYDVAANDGNDAYIASNPNIIFRTKNTSGKNNAFVILPGTRFVYGGKNGMVLIKNTNAGDTIRITVASKGSTNANFLDDAGVYPVNAVALSENLTLPAYGSGSSSDPYVWEELTYVSLGGDVQIKEFAGGFAIKKIVISNEGQPIIEKELITIRLDSASYQVCEWENAYAYVWTGSTSAYDAYYQNNNVTRIVWSEHAESDGNGYYKVSFEIDTDTPYNFFWSSSPGDYPSSSWCVTNQSGSICCEYTNSTGLVIACCYDEDATMDTVTIRLNPLSIEWDNVYAYAWQSDQDYTYYNSTRRNRRLTWAEKATIDEEGWYAVSFPKDLGAAYSFTWRNDSLTYYNTSFYSDTIRGVTGSVCCNESNSKLTVVPCNSIVPTASTTFVIHEITAGTLGQLLVSQMDQWSDVKSLIVTGTMNETDMDLFSYMTELQYLDLSGTNISSISGCRNLYYLQEVVLPTTCTSIAARAFQGCKRLKSINLEHVLNIGEYAFCLDESPNSSWYYYSGLSSLKTINMPVVQTIGRYAFAGSRSLSECVMDSVQSIGEYAFANCPLLTSIAIPNAVSLGTYAFYYSSNQSLRTIILSDELEEIPSYCFYWGNNPQTVNIPISLRKIGDNALYTASDTIILPEGLAEVSSYNFYTSHVISIPSSIQKFSSFSSTWTDIYCHAVDPTFTNPFANRDLSNTTLYVPTMSLAAYKLSDDFHGFKQILPLNSDVSVLNIRGNMMLLSLNGISSNADMIMHPNSELMVSLDTNFSIGNYKQYISTFDNKYYTGYSSSGPWYSNIPCTGMLMANSTIVSDDVEIRLVPRANRWNFFSLPFDVNMQDITIETEGVSSPGTSQWVIREYSGANRAAGSGATWVNVPASGILQAHKGYILYWAVNNSSNYSNNSSSNSSMPTYSSFYWFRMPAVNNSNKQNLFSSENVSITLSEYPAEAFQNSSWNLVGNPYPCALTIEAIDFNAPITVWNGNSYMAYSLQDDDYVLRPAEAFFVQVPQGETSMTFYKAGRSISHTREITKTEYDNRYQAPKRRTNDQVERRIFNFYLSNDEYSDRARLVFNEQASMEYEIRCDAAKMFSSDNEVPQLFVNNNDILYAIDERPIQNGQFILGAVFGKNGTYTLSVDQSENSEEQVILIDMATGVSTDLSADSYTFTSEAGTFENRFHVSLVPAVSTSIEENDVHGLQPLKTLRDGHLIIVAPNGKTYTAEGKEL